MATSAVLFGAGFVGALAGPHVFGSNPYKVWYGLIMASMGVALVYSVCERWRR